MRTTTLLAGILVVLVAGAHNAAQGSAGPQRIPELPPEPGTATGCAELGKVKSAFPAPKTIGFTERDQIAPQPARQPIRPGRCGAFWTTYNGDGKSVNISVTLYRSPQDVAAALAEPQFGPVHLLANGARVRTAGPSSASVNGTPASATGAASAFGNIFISSTSISTAMTPVPVAAQLRIHHLIETALARHATH